MNKELVRKHNFIPGAMANEIKAGKAEIRATEKKYGQVEWNVVILHLISPSASGTHQPEEIVEGMDLDLDPQDEFFWDEVYNHLSPIENDLREALKAELGASYDIGFYHVFDGDFGLILSKKEK